MKTLMVGDCAFEGMFQVHDPDAAAETDFEAVCVRALNCFYPQHTCVVFGGSFLHEGQVSRPDLALVANDLSHWYVIEVELASHSLEGHVLPQVRALRYGDPQPDCAKIIARELAMEESQVATLVRMVPRGTAVIVNKSDTAWERALSGIPVQYLSLTTYRGVGGREALEIEGKLEIDQRHVGFGTYSATDRSFRFPSVLEVPEGAVSVSDPYGAASVWRCRREGRNLWITKEVGVPTIPNGAMMQLVQYKDGRFALRSPSSSVRSG